MLKILGKAESINVAKVLWACDEMGIEFERVDWGMPYRDPKAAEYLALNPNATVPVIDDDGFVLWESNSIIRYLANRQASDLYPSAPSPRAMIDQWIDWQAADLNPAFRYAFGALVRKFPGFTDEGQIEDSRLRWTQKMQIAGAQLEKTGAFIAGPTFTLADIPIGLSVLRWQRTPIDKPDFPALDAYLERLGERRWFNERVASDLP